MTTMFCMVLSLNLLNLQPTLKTSWMWSTSTRHSCTCVLMIRSCMTSVNLMMCRVCVKSTVTTVHLTIAAVKTEVIWFGLKSNMNKLHRQEHHIQTGSWDYHSCICCASQWSWCVDDTRCCCVDNHAAIEDWQSVWAKQDSSTSAWL